MLHVEPVETLARRCLAVRSVNHDRAPILLRRVIPAPDAHVDVCRHVRQMSGCRHKRAQYRGRRNRPLGCGRRFDCVDVKVRSAGVTRIGGENTLKHANDFISVSLRLTVARPQVPWLKIHERLGVQGRNVVIIGNALIHTAHCRGIRLVERFAVGWRRPSVSRSECVDECLFDWTRVRAKLLCFGKRLERELRAFLWHHGIVDMRTVTQRDAPPRDRKGGIEFRCARERPDRFVVIARKRPHEPLIEVRLRSDDARARWPPVCSHSFKERSGRPAVGAASQAGGEQRGGESNRSEGFAVSSVH